MSLPVVRMSVRAVVAVSYTHLDVYKRQERPLPLRQRQEI